MEDIIYTSEKIWRMRLISNDNLSYKILNVLLPICILIILNNELQGQSIDYSVIQDNQFSYVSLAKDRGVKEIKQYKISEKSIPFITKGLSYSLNVYLPFTWKIKEDIFFNFTGNGKYPSNNYKIGILQFYPVVQIDSIETVSEWKELNKRILKKEDLDKLSAKRSLEKYMNSKHAAIDPLKHHFKEYYFESNALEKATKNLSYDFLVFENSILVFLRANENFTIWRADFVPESRLESVINWEELVTYTPNKLYKSPFNNPWVENSKVPSGNKHIFQSIKDQNFFKGHFTVFQQGKNLFLLNTDLGSIYHIGEKSIDKIGQLRQYKGSKEKGLLNYPDWIFGQRVFIEDKDQERLIILKYHVEQLRKDLPFPKITIIKSQEELKQLLKFL